MHVKINMYHLVKRSLNIKRQKKPRVQIIVPWHIIITTELALHLVLCQSSNGLTRETTTGTMYILQVKSENSEVSYP